MKNMTKMFMGISFGLVIFSGACGMIPKSLTPSVGDVHYPPLHNYVHGEKMFHRTNSGHWRSNNAASRPTDLTDNRQSDDSVSESRSQPNDLRNIHPIHNSQLGNSISGSRSQPSNLINVQGQHNNSNQGNQEAAPDSHEYTDIATSPIEPTYNGAPIIYGHNVYICSGGFSPVPFYSQSSNFSPVPAYGQSNNYCYRQDARRSPNYRGYSYRPNNRHQENDQ